MFIVRQGWRCSDPLLGEGQGPVGSGKCGLQDALAQRSPDSVAKARRESWSYAIDSHTIIALVHPSLAYVAISFTQNCIRIF